MRRGAEGSTPVPATGPVDSTIESRVDPGVHPSSPLTIGDFLALPAVAHGLPKVVAGVAELGRRIRWLHVTELTDTEGLLQGGELILTTGIALPPSATEIGRYIDMLADQGAVGLVLELGRRFDAAPPGMLRACERRRFPLILLYREVQFVALTEAAHSVILGAQSELLRVTAAAYERFTELHLAAASVDQLVSATGELANGSVVFANLMHQVLAVEVREGSTKWLLRRWRETTFSNGTSGTVVDAEHGTVQAPVEVRGRQRGRIVLFTADAPTPTQVMVLARAAEALAIRIQLDSDEALVAQARRTVLSDIIFGRYATPEAMHARTASLGHPTYDRQMLPLVVLGAVVDLRKVMVQALFDAHLDALTADLGDGTWGVLLLFPPGNERGVEAFAERVHELSAALTTEPLTVARGGIVVDLSSVKRSFAEALETAQAVRGSNYQTQARACYSIRDVQLRGLLYTMRGDPRLQAFVGRLLGPLLVRDERDGGDWVRTLAVYLRLRGNKSLAAQELNISRPTLYERLSRIQRLLQLDLDDPESSTSLYAAIMFAETARPPGHADAGSGGLDPPSRRGWSGTPAA